MAIIWNNTIIIILFLDIIGIVVLQSILPPFILTHFKINIEVTFSIEQQPTSCFRLAQMVIQYNKAFHCLFSWSFKFLFSKVKGLGICHTLFS